MGKAKNRKRFSKSSRNKSTPWGNAEDRPGEFPPPEGHLGPDVDNREEELLRRIAADIKSGSSDAKETGCSSLAMVADGAAAEGILRWKLPKMVGPLMAVDKDPSVRHAAVGALKNLSLVSADVCEEMVRQDVMTPLCALLSSYGMGDCWEASKCEMTSSRVFEERVVDSKKDIFVEAVTLLWNLCEASSSALEVFNRENLVAVLLAHLDRARFGREAVSAVLQCLYTVTEDNPAASKAVVEGLGPADHILARFCPSSDGASPEESLYHRILACGIALNCSGGGGGCAEDPSSAPAFAPVLAVVSQVLDQDQRKLVHDYTSSMSLDGGPTAAPKVQGKWGRGQGPAKGDDEDKMESDGVSTQGGCDDGSLDSLRVRIDQVVLAQQTALEILTNLCCDEDDVDDWEDMEEDVSSSDGGDSFQEEILEAGYSSASESAFLQRSAVAPVVLEAVASNGLVGKVLAKAKFPADNALEILAGQNSQRYGGKTILRMLSTLRIRAFLCLNNLVGALTLEDLGGPDAAVQVWTGLGLLCFKSQPPSSRQQPNQTEFLEASTSAMRALTQKIVDSGKVGSDALGSKLARSDVERVLAFGAEAPDAHVRTNVVQIAGCLGTIAVAAQQGLVLAECREMLALFLVEAASRDADLRVVAEALDKLFDMFAEDETDRFCAQIGLVAKLKQMLPGLKVKVGMLRRTSKKSDPETCAVVEVAKTNLVRFIKYKEGRLAGGAPGRIASNGAGKS